MYARLQLADQDQQNRRLAGLDLLPALRAHLEAEQLDDVTPTVDDPLALLPPQHDW